LNDGNKYIEILDTIHLEDVQLDNIVLSMHIADAESSYSVDKGFVGVTKAGWGNKLF
jgi:flagellar basal body L-ring protein FlgH